MNEQKIMVGNEVNFKKFCHGCGKTIHASASLCPNCGATQSVQNTSSPIDHVNLSQKNLNTQKSNHVFCRGCGEAIHETAKTCPQCGAIQLKDSGQGKKYDRITAALLAIFLGTFGIHKFYLGNTGLGILYLLFCWTWIPTIVGIIEGIVFFTQSDESFNLKYFNR